MPLLRCFVVGIYLEEKLLALLKAPPSKVGQWMAAADRETGSGRMDLRPNARIRLMTFVSF